LDRSRAAACNDLHTLLGLDPVPGIHASFAEEGPDISVYEKGLKLHAALDPFWTADCGCLFKEIFMLETDPSIVPGCHKIPTLEVVVHVE